jgi:hypothetical protein
MELDLFRWRKLEETLKPSQIGLNNFAITPFGSQYWSVEFRIGTVSMNISVWLAMEFKDGNVRQFHKLLHHTCPPCFQYRALTLRSGYSRNKLLYQFLCACSFTCHPNIGIGSRAISITTRTWY